MAKPTNAVHVATKQLGSAEAWRSLATQHGVDVIIQFTSLYSGFNAVFWAWNYVHNGPARPSERAMIDALLRELSTRAVENLDTQSATAVRTLLRDKPQGLRNLDRRTHDPDGERNDGREANELMRSTDARDRSRGLAKAMYLIRCNLVHGSKHFVEERSLVEAVTPSMGLYLDAGIDLLDSWVRGQNGTSSSSSS